MDEQESSILSTKEEYISNNTIVNDKFEYESDTRSINLKKKDVEVFRNSKFFRCILVDSSTSKCLKEIECDEEKAGMIVSLCQTSPRKNDIKEKERKSEEERKKEEENNRNRYILEQNEEGSQMALQEDFMAVAMSSETSTNHRLASNISGDFKKGNMDTSKIPREIMINQERRSSRDDNDDRRDSIETNSSSGSSCNSGFLAKKIKRINRTMRNKK